MITRKRLAAGVSGLLAALALGLLPTPAAAADEPGAADAKPSPKVELVLDVSGSMRARDIDGKSRMAAAKQAFNEVLDAVPPQVRLGIRTLGANYPGEDRQLGCKDTKQLYPVGRWTAPRPRPRWPPSLRPAGRPSDRPCWPRPTTSRATTRPGGSS